MPKGRDDFNAEQTTTDWGAYSDPDISPIDVRGASYLLKSGEKNPEGKKTRAGEMLFDLVSLDIKYHEDNQHLQHVCSNSNSRVAKYLRRNPEQNNTNISDEKKKSTKFFVFNFFIGFGDKPLTYTITLKRNDIDCPRFEPIWDEFVNGTDAQRNERLKFMPNVIQGNWAVTRAVGTVPAIIGKKLACTYYTDEDKNYIEVDCDVGSSMIARNILGLATRYATNMVIDFFFLLECHQHKELPEVLIGGVRSYNIVLDDVPY